MARALLLLTAVAAVLRVISLDAQLWYDEIITLMYFVRPPLWDAVTSFPGSNNHPLYSVFAQASLALFGEHPWSLRLPAVVFGVASVPMLYRLGTVVGSRLEAMLAACLLAVSYHHVWFSQNARGYTAQLFAALLATWLLLRMLERPRMSLALAYGVTIALGIYTHLTTASIAAGHALVWGVWLWTRRRDPRWRRDVTVALTAVGIGVVGTALLYAPMVAQIIASFQKPSARAVAAATPTWAALEIVRGLRVGLGAVGVAGGIALTAFGAWSYWRQSRFIAALFLVPLLVTALAVVGSGSPIRPRFFFVLVGFGILIVVRGAVAVGGRLAVLAGRPARAEMAGAALVGVLIVLSAATLPKAYRHPKQDFTGAIRYVNEHRAPNEPVATAGLASIPLIGYYELPWTHVRTRDDVNRVRAGSPRLWLVYSLPESLDAGLKALLRSECPVAVSLTSTLGNGNVVVHRCDGPAGKTR